MKRDYNYCYHLVAFIDVLGQKEAFQGIDVIPAHDDESTKKKLVKAHEETAYFIEIFREAFEDIFNTYVEDYESKVLVPAFKKAKFDEIRRCILKHQRFSDCIEAFVPLQTEKYHANAVNGVYGILAACGGMLLISLAEKKAFRAGLDVGIATELKNGEVYGPALFKAYKLESEVAQYPRIVLGNELINYLENLSRKNPQFPDQNEEDIEVCKIMADSCLKMIVKDLDGYLILDYLGEEFRNRFLNFPFRGEMTAFDDIYSTAFDYVGKEYMKRKDTGDSKLALRYYLLFNYFKARLPKK